MVLNLLPAATMTDQVVIPEGSPWFQGHFPGNPLLPGIAQLHLVMDAIRATQGDAVCLTGLKRVRFKRIIRPEETIDITVDPVPDKPGLYRFQLTIEGEIACSGLVLTGPPEGEDA